MSDDVKITLQPGEQHQIARAASTFLLAKAGAKIDVQLYRNGQRFIHAAYAESGYRYVSEMDMAILRNNNAAAVEIVFYMTRGPVEVQVNGEFASRITNTVADPVPVSIQTPVTLTATDVGVLSLATLATAADVAIAAAPTPAAVVVAAAGVGVKQRECIVKNLTANVAALRIGDANTGAARGHELMPGESLTLDTLAAIYAYNTGAGAQSLSVVTNSRS